MLVTTRVDSFRKDVIDAPTQYSHEGFLPIADHLKSLIEEESLLAYTYPMDLYALMAADWPHFAEPFLGPDKRAWATKFSVLAKVRTPLAHNREEAVNEAERVQAEGVCREILQRYEDWKSTHLSP